MSTCIIRPMQDDEFPLIIDFLYEAIYQPEGGTKLPKDIVFHPELIIYHADFGQGRADYCLCAELNQQIVGAIWIRQIKGYGTIDELTPELTMAVLEEHRNRGVGQALLKAMIAYLKSSHHQRVSLSVQKANKTAWHLYRKFGFKELKKTAEESIMVLEV